MIKFNEVTWYSKLATIIFLIGVLPALTFYIGTRYQEVENVDEIMSQQVETSAVIIDKSDEPQESLGGFSKGTYEFGEGAGAGQVWRYRTYIKNDGGTGPITLYVDGHLTMTRINAIGVRTGKNLDVVFDSYAPENTSTGFKKGEVLFTLSLSQDDPLYVEWKAIQPNLEGSKKDSVFVKISDSQEL